MMLLSVVWDADPTMLEIGPVTIRWYGLLFATAFVVGLLILQRIIKEENAPETWSDTAFIYMIVGTVLGARLGHCLFYEPAYYLANPVEMLKIWRGGLASHGAAVGIPVALWLFSRNVTKMPFLWIMDRMSPQIALAGLFIRTGNLMNSEIYGHQTDLPWGFVFVRDGQTLPMHPTQLYEAILYTFSAALLLYIYFRTERKHQLGYLFGWFTITSFGGRFLIEFVKNDQANFEAGMFLNMGQLLSIPLILIGIYLVARKQAIQRLEPPKWKPVAKK